MALTAADIIGQVQHVRDQPGRQALEIRMDEDFQRWRLKPYAPPLVLYGLMKTTLNEPRTLGDKVVDLIAQAKVAIRVPNADELRDERDANNDKERFGIGCLHAGDEHLSRTFQKPLRSQLAWYGALRGYIVGRSMLAKDKNSRTYVNIQPWDPRQTYWGIGNEGLDWICAIHRRSRDQTQLLYDVRLPAPDRGSEAFVDLYDYYTASENIIAAEGNILKQAPHGADRVPAFLSASGHQPMVVERETEGMAEALYGESVFHSNRENWDARNFLASVMMHLAALSVRPPLKHTTRDAHPLEEDPYITGTILNMYLGENMEPAQLIQMAKEVGLLLQVLTGEGQRGGLPHSTWGELQFQLSSVAIKTLREGIMTVIQPVVQATEEAYLQILNLLADQYITGMFDPLEVAGLYRDRKWFKKTITPDIVAQGGNFTVQLKPNLPSDDPAKMQMAIMARQGAVPTYSDLTVHEKILEDDDADLEMAQIKEQLGERSDPIVATYELMKAAEDRGDTAQAKMHYAKLQIMMMEIQAKLMMGQAALQTAPAGNGGGGPGSFSEDVLPRMATGMPAQVVPQVGPNMPAGSPRPGARNGGQPEMGQEG